MNFTQFLAVVWARRWLALAVLLLTVGATVAVSLLMPKQYTATAAVVLEMKGDPIVGALFPNMGQGSYMGTQVDIFNSDRVARRVVENLRLNENPEVRAEWMEVTGGRGSFDDWLARRLKDNLEVLPARESSIINVSYTAKDPQHAADMANGFLRAYLDTTLDLRVDPAKQYASFFDERAQELREQLEAAQARLSTYQRDKGIIATDERLDIETARLNELSSQLVALQAVASESRSRSQQARRAGDRLEEVISNPVVAGIRAELAREESQLQQLTTRLGDAHPQVVQARASIRELRQRLGQETARVAGSVNVADQINRQREAELRAQLEQQRARVMQMKANRDEAAVLMKDVENVQRAYDEVLDRRNQTALESHRTTTNATPLTQAVAPLLPSSPRIVLNTLLSVIVGGMLALGSILLLEFLDRRVRGPRDLTEALGIPVLGVLPRPTHRRGLFGRRQAPLLAQRVVGRTPQLQHKGS